MIETGSVVVLMFALILSFINLLIFLLSPVAKKANEPNTTYIRLEAAKAARREIRAIVKHKNEQRRKAGKK